MNERTWIYDQMTRAWLSESEIDIPTLPPPLFLRPTCDATIEAAFWPTRDVCENECAFVDNWLINPEAWRRQYRAAVMRGVEWRLRNV